jgi:hypothetical protein
MPDLEHTHKCLLLAAALCLLTVACSLQEQNIVGGYPFAVSMSVESPPTQPGDRYVDPIRIAYVSLPGALEPFVATVTVTKEKCVGGVFVAANESVTVTVKVETPGDPDSVTVYVGGEVVSSVVKESELSEGTETAFVSSATESGAIVLEIHTQGVRVLVEIEIPDESGSCPARPR